jgi:cellulose biosynthesis protein BcsQ
VKTIGVYNIKGGVGKTTTTVNIAFMAAQAGYRTLIWDLDPQGAASYYFRITPKVKGGSKALLKGKRSMDDAIKGTDYEDLDLLPADFSYRHMDLALDGGKKSNLRLRKLIEPLADEYDCVFLDCPPSISLVSENIFSAADKLLVPTIPTTLSQRTLEQLTDFVADNDSLKDLEILPFFTMVDRRKNLHKDLIQSLRASYPNTLGGEVPYASDVERMGIQRMPLPVFAPNSAAAGAYRELWSELRLKLES